MNSICRRILLIFSLASHCAFADGPTPRPNPERFAGEIAAFARQEPEKGGIVFTGSSSIRLWSALKEDFSGLPVVNRGFGGCVSNDLIVHFDTLIARHEPKLIVTYVGGNDIAEKLTVQEAFDDYTKFLALAHDRFPKTRIILNSIKFAPKRALQIPQVRELNHRLKTWAADKNWLRFLDSTRFLAGPGDQPDPAYFREDQLHLNAAGYAKWRAILEPVVREEWAKVHSEDAAEPATPSRETAPQVPARHHPEG
jgi:lysophospholipase L1-like esterase